MPYRVVQWSTGNVGRHSLAGIDAHPDLQLIGVYVSNPDKVGHDAASWPDSSVPSAWRRPATPRHSSR